MGDGYGPMLIARAGTTFPDPPEIRDWLRQRTIAIPGRMTSAFLALQLYMSEVNAVEVPFDQIFAFVRAGKAEVGLIIHEGQLTYEREGFRKLLDLGAWWKAETGLPLPLGGNVIRKDIAPQDRSEINAILRDSIRYGLEHRAAGVAHAMPHARGMDTTLADRFIGMYVNEFTLDYGDLGRRAIREFLRRGDEAGLIQAPAELEFVG
jgi:1,4-dihydroxy-6-naphthoate synthase